MFERRKQRFTMTRRRVSGLALLACAAVALSAGIATAHAPKRAHVKPAVSVLSATKSGGALHVSIRALFTIPVGISAAKACRGKLALASKGLGRKNVKQQRTLKHVAGSPGSCAALFAIKLPQTSYGKKVVFKLTLNGNQAIAPFTVKAQLKLAAKPSGPSPFDGAWQGPVTSPSTESGTLYLPVTNGVANDPYLLGGGFTVQCTSNSQYYNWDMRGQKVPIAGNGAFGGLYQDYAPPNSVGTGKNMTLKLHGQLNTKPNFTGTFTLSATGTITYAHAVYNCTGSASGTLYKQ